MQKLSFVDIGELGWSLYLAAHLRWLKDKADLDICVYTDKNREVLYDGLADRIRPIPTEISDHFKDAPPNCFGRYLIPDQDIRKYVNKHIPEDYPLSESIKFNCGRTFLEKVTFKPYIQDMKTKVRNNILVFPRYRTHARHSFRNLPKSFYQDLINELCTEFNDISIISIGIPGQAYDIESDCINYWNLVSNTTTLKELFYLLTASICTIGGTSAPPKIAMLQGVPSYVIGHEKDRFVKEENWSKTPVKFREIDINDYNEINDPNCIKEIVEWIKTLIR